MFSKNELDRTCLFWHVLLLFKQEKHERKTRLGEYFRAFFMEIITN